MYNPNDPDEIIDFYTYLEVPSDSPLEKINKAIDTELEFWNGISAEHNFLLPCKNDKLELLNFARSAFSSERARKEYDILLDSHYEKHNDIFQVRREEYNKYYQLFLHLQVSELGKYKGLLEQLTIYNMDNPDWIYFSFHMCNTTKDYKNACFYAGRLLFLKKPTNEAIVAGFINCLNYIRDKKQFSDSHSEKRFYQINPNPLVVLDSLFAIIKNRHEYTPLFATIYSHILVDSIIELNDQKIFLDFLDFIKLSNKFLSIMGVITEDEPGNSEYMENNYKFGLYILKAMHRFMKTGQFNYHTEEGRQNIINNLAQARLLTTPFEKISNIQEHKVIVLDINQLLDQNSERLLRPRINTTSGNSAIEEYKNKQVMAVVFVVVILIAIGTFYYFGKSDDDIKVSTTRSSSANPKPVQLPIQRQITLRTIPENEVENISSIHEIDNSNIQSVESSGFLTSKSGMKFNPEKLIDKSFDTWWTPFPERDGTNSWVSINLTRVEKIHGLSIYPGSGKYRGKHIWNDNNVLKQFKLEFRNTQIGMNISLMVDLDDLEKPGLRKIYFTPNDANIIILHPISWKSGQKWNDLCISHLKPLIR